MKEFSPLGWRSNILLPSLCVIALSRDPSFWRAISNMDGEVFRGRVTTRHSVIRPRPGSLYDGSPCHHWNITCSVSPRNKCFQYCEFLAWRSKMPTTTLFTRTRSSSARSSFYAYSQRQSYMWFHLLLEGSKQCVNAPTTILQIAYMIG